MAITIFRRKRVNRFVCDKPQYLPMFILCIAGVIGALLVTAYIRNDVRNEAIKSAKVFYYPADYCLVCHGPRNAEPVIKGYRDYKKAHPSPADKRRAKRINHDKLLLQDLRSAL